MKKIISKLKNKKFQKQFLIFLVLLGLTLFLANTAWAQTQPTEAPPDEVKNWIGRFFSFVFSYIISFEGWILVILTRLLLAIVKYNGFVNSPAVLTGWTLVRDVANMFFILVMLAIALGTILHIESYNFKRLLPKVLIMAILVNFSRLLCGLAIDFAQVIMMTFAVGFASIAGAGDLMATLHITQMLNAASNTTLKNSATNFTSTFITGLLAVILLLVAIITVLVMLVVIVMRMIMLWLLVVLSPLPFVLSAFPSGQKYAQQWTQEFFKYVIVGPVLAFFLWLGLAVSAGGGNNNNLGAIVNDDAMVTELSGINQVDSKVNTGVGEDESTETTVFTGIGNPDNFLAFLIGIGMLMGGLMITQQLGVAGGAFAGQMSNAIRQKGLSALTSPGRLAKWGAGLGAGALRDKLDRGLGKYSSDNKGWRGRVAGFLSPTVRREGWKQSKADLEREAFPQAIGRMNDFLNKKFHGSDTFNERMAFNTAVTSRQSEISKVGHSALEHSAMFDEALKSGDKVEVAALGKILVQNNQFDDYAGYKNMHHDPESLRDHLQENMERTMGKETAGDIGVMLSEFAEATGKMRLANYARTETVMENGKLVTRNVWNSKASAKEELEAEKKAGKIKGDITDEMIRERFESNIYSEFKTKAGRADMEKYVGSQEGKAYAETYTDVGNAPMVLNILDMKEFKAAQHGLSNEGMIRLSAEDDIRASDIVDSRRNKMQARFKEIIGLSTDQDGNERLDLTTLADLFRSGRHKTATNGLAHFISDKSQFALIQETLKSMGVTGPKGEELDLMKVASKNAKEEMRANLTPEQIAKAKTEVESNDKIKNMADGYKQRVQQRDDFFYRKDQKQGAAPPITSTSSEAQSAPAVSGPKPNTDQEATWNRMDNKQQEKYKAEAKSPAGQRARGNKTVTSYAKELAHQAHLKEFNEKQAEEITTKETEIVQKSKGNNAERIEVVQKAPADIENIVGRISGAMEAGMDTSGIITALQSLGTIMQSLKDPMAGISEGKVDVNGLDKLIAEIRSKTSDRAGSNLGEPNSTKDLLFRINKSIKELSQKVLSENDSEKT